MIKFGKKAKLKLWNLIWVAALYRHKNENEIKEELGMNMEMFITTRAAVLTKAVVTWK